MTINYAAIDRTKNDFGLNISESLALDAGVVGHEGAHVGAGGFLTEFFTMHGEHTAYYSESLTYQGLHNTDRPTGLWNESWVLVDRQLLEQKREKAIEDVLHPRRSQTKSRRINHENTEAVSEGFGSYPDSQPFRLGTS